MEDSNPLVELFKSMASVLGYGLLGLAFIIIFITAYLILKRPDKKALILTFMFFCAFILCFLAYVGVGLSKENQVITNNSQQQKKTITTLQNVATGLIVNIKSRDSILSSIKGVGDSIYSSKNLISSQSNIANSIQTLKQTQPGPLLLKELSSAEEYYRITPTLTK